MLLNNAYIGLHLEDESEKIVRNGIKDCEVLGSGIIPAKWLHLTLDYRGSIEFNMLESHTFATRVMLLIANNAKNYSPIKLGTPSHTISDATGEDIFFLPALTNNGLFGHLQYQGYSVRIPHITLLKGKNMTEIQIEKTLALLESILSGTGLEINTKEVFCHGKVASDGREIVKGFICSN